MERGQGVWRTLGGMDVGSVWGHGGYVAPDWTADWLHRECEFVLEAWARAERGSGYAALPLDQQAGLRARLAEMLHENRYDPAVHVLTIDAVRARAFESNLRHYAQVFGAGQTEYAIPKGTLTDPARQHALAAFFFWTAWSATALRPGDDASYTSNWPHEPLIGNGPTGDALVWTGVSVPLGMAYSGWPAPKTFA